MCIANFTNPTHLFQDLFLVPSAWRLNEFATVLVRIVGERVAHENTATYKIGSRLIECQGLVRSLDVFPKHGIRKSEHGLRSFGKKRESPGKPNRTNGIENPKTSLYECQEESDVAKLWIDSLDRERMRACACPNLTW